MFENILKAKMKTDVNTAEIIRNVTMTLSIVASQDCCVTLVI